MRPDDILAGVRMARHCGAPRLFPDRKRPAIKPRLVVCLAVSVHFYQSRSVVEFGGAARRGVGEAGPLTDGEVQRREMRDRGFGGR